MALEPGQLNEAEQRFDAGDLAGAEAALKRVMKDSPRAAEPHVLLGRMRAAEGRWPEAIRCYEEAVLRESAHVAARYYLAEALIHAGEILRATSQLHYLQQLVPRYVPGILLRGDIALYQGDHRQAIVEYCRAIALEPVEAPIYTRLAEAYLAIDDQLQALKAYESAIQAAPTHWEAYLAAARLCERQKRWAKAKRYYLAIAFNPSLRAEAQKGLERVEAYYQQFDLSRPLPGAEPTEDAGFAVPETFDAPPRPLPRPAPMPPTQRLQSHNVTRPLQRPELAPKPPTAQPKPAGGTHKSALGLSGNTSPRQEPRRPSSGGEN